MSLLSSISCHFYVDIQYLGIPWHHKSLKKHDKELVGVVETTLHDMSILQVEHNSLLGINKAMEASSANLQTELNSLKIQSNKDQQKIAEFDNILSNIEKANAELKAQLIAKKTARIKFEIAFGCCILDGTIKVDPAKLQQLQQ